MLRFRGRLIALLLALGLGSLLLGVAHRPAYAASANLVWKPYLQELTDTSVVIQWMTRSGTSSDVRYSADPSYSASASGTARSIAALGTQMHRVALGGLRPNTTYFYKIYTDNEDLWPERTLTFRTAPSRGSATPFTFAAFGDFGTGAVSQQRLRDQMARDSFQFLVTTGDNAYDAGRYAEFDTRVFQVYGDVFSTAAVFPTLGNHEYLTSSGAPYLDLFSLPRNAWRSSDQERYYSFDYGNAHIVALDSNTPLDASDSAAADDMFDWLRDDLSRTTQPWIIAVLHHAPYSTGSHGSDSRVQSKLVPIFEQYGVDLVLSGHDHSYQRAKPLRSGQVTPVAQGGIVYVVTGAGSAASYGCGSAEWLALAYCAKTYGIYSRIHVNGSLLTVEAVDDAGTVRDSFTLGHDAPPNTVTLPGRFEAEDYRSGGPGVGYFDSTAGNSGGVYRADDVDLQACGDGSPCYNVGWVTAGEWLAYDVSVATSGSYTFGVRAATPYSGKQVHLEVDGVNVSGPLTLTNTGSWQTWATVTTAPISLAAGRHTLRLVADSSSLNLDYVVAAASPPPAPEPTTTPIATATPTNAPTNTPIATATPTNTPIATATPTNAPTNTSTPTSTPANTPTPTSTPAPTSTPTNTPIATPTPAATAAPTTLTLITSADARVEETKPTTNYGTSSSLRVDGGSDPDVESYLRFTVTGVAAPIQSARLRVYATSGTSNGPALYATGNAWSETGITWNTRPARIGSALDDRGAVAANAWVEYDVTPLITGDGTYNVVLVTDSTDGMSLASRQGSFPPQLIVTVAASSPLPPTRTPTPAPTGTIAPTATPTPPPSNSIALPGRFEAEDYRSGGPGVGYFDSTAGNSGGVYRADDVDLQACGDGSPCYNVGWVTAGEWLAYDVSVATSGSYTFGVRAATPYSGKQVHLEVDGVNVSGPLALPNTGSWQTWATVTTAPISLTRGAHTLRLVADSSSLNLNYISVSGP